jgi:hypothetical protein
MAPVNHQSSTEDIKQLVTEGPLVYLSNYSQNKESPEAGLEKARKTFEKLQGHVAVLAPDGSFNSGKDAITTESLKTGMVVKVGQGDQTHYYKKVAEQISTSIDQPNATAWIEVSQPTKENPQGKPLNPESGKLIIAAAGFTGDASRVKAVLQGAARNTSEEEALFKATPTTMFFQGGGGYNPQIIGMENFLDRAINATKEQGMKVAELENIGHSMGASVAAASNALAIKKGLNSTVLFTEPHQLASQLSALRKDVGAKGVIAGIGPEQTKSLTSDSATLWSGRGMMQQLGLGATESGAQFTVAAKGDMSGLSGEAAAKENHEMANIVQANLGTNGQSPKPLPIAQSNTPANGQMNPLESLGEFGALLGMIVTLLTGGGLNQGKGNGLDQLLAGLSGVTNSNPSTPAGPGNVPSQGRSNSTSIT